jgi:site-specific recombinase XerD
MQVILKPLHHRGQQCIGIYFEKNAVLQSLIQKKISGRWSQTNKCWYIPCTGENYLLLKTALENKAELEITELKKFLLEKRKTNPEPTLSNNDKNMAGFENRGNVKVADFQKVINLPKPVTTQIKLSKENAEAMQEFSRQLHLKAYSQSTIKTYTNEFTQFLQTVKDKSATDFSVSRLKDYFEYCYTKLHLSENTLHSRINALKFYYEQVLNREKFFWEIPRPKKPLILPKLLNETEISKLFNALANKKHKAMLFTAYSAGLRVSEIVNLKIADIDSGRMQILIERAKGKKDRYVNLSPLLLDILRKYLLEYTPRPVKYLFESEQTKAAYPTRTVQQIFYNAKNKAGIKKEVGIHSLRHSFATHLLDKGTDIKYIKDLLGHFNIKTTERYLHVSKKQLINIVSPFDDLWQKQKIDW